LISLEDVPREAVVAAVGSEFNHIEKFNHIETGRLPLKQLENWVYPVS
jgi:hypothetical protein